MQQLFFSPFVILVPFSLWVWLCCVGQQRICVHVLLWAPRGVSGAWNVYRPGGHSAGETASAWAPPLPACKASGWVPWRSFSLSSGSAGRTARWQRLSLCPAGRGAEIKAAGSFSWRYPWLVFVHTSCEEPSKRTADGCQELRGILTP